MKYDVCFCSWSSGSVTVEAKSEAEAKQLFCDKADTYDKLIDNFGVDWIDAGIDLNYVAVAESEICNAIKRAVPGNLVFATHVCRDTMFAGLVRKEAREEFGDEADENDLCVAVGNVLANLIDEHFKRRNK